MLFNSLDFFLFLGAFFVFWPFMRGRQNLRYMYLVTCSFVFYGWWDWRLLFLLLGNGLIVFFAGLGIAHFNRRGKIFLVTSLIGNIGSLAVFKYLDFCITNLNWLLEFLGLNNHIGPVGLILPIGISFYTFQAMTYTVDVYRGRLEPTTNIAHFFAYLSMFPQLVAGPIVRASDLLPQLKEIKATTEQQRWEGLRLIVHGFFKKVVIADNLAWAVNGAFGSAITEASCVHWWVVITMFAFQIYCDFSGYSDIARGLGKWMGYEFPLNFNHPYISSSFREFWSRWHISLSTWFRDYVYIPLGGSRKGKLSSHINMWITMLLSGLWHGAGWTFVIWAGLHSVYLSLERITEWPHRLRRLRGGRHLVTLLVFVLVLVSWVFFRAQSFGQAASILSAMFNFGNANFDIIGGFMSNRHILFLFLIILRELYFYFGLETSEWITSRLFKITQPVILSLVIAACVLLRGPGDAFIYFQF